MIVLALVMPNALRLPQQDPSPVLEYAPVPPSDDEPPNPPPGNLNSLALGSSSTLSEGAPPAPPKGKGDRPGNSRCVGKPPRQTEDPMSPPCVPYFQGDNFGTTWQGVTKDEINVVVYFDPGSYNNESSPGGGKWIDVDAPPKPACTKGVSDSDPDACDHQLIRETRALATFFNARFQTYGRHAHFWAYFANGGHPNTRRNDAAVIMDEKRPFAVLDQATFNGNNQAFQDAIAARSALVFTSETTLPNAFFRKYERYLWGFWPDVEHWASMYTTYVCTKIVPYPVKRMGNPPGADPHIGKPRRFGLFYTEDQGEPGLRLFADMVKKGVTRCGANIVSERTFPENRFVVDNRDSGVDQQQAVAAFQNADVTTVLYLGGVEGKFSQMADAQKYYPEVIIADDLNQGNNSTGRLQNANVWRNAWAVHFQLRFDRPEKTPGYAAYREADSTAPLEEARYVNDLYRDHFMLFQAIQVAGPRLTPTSIDQGFHAIPEKASDDPYVASCFFDPGDYSCVKDAVEIWWDTEGVSPGDRQPGCWRMVRAGRRYLAGAWPGGKTTVFDNPRDPCTGYDASRRIRTG